MDTYIGTSCIAGAVSDTPGPRVTLAKPGIFCDMI